VTWAAVRPGAALQSAVLTAGTTASETIKVTALTAALAYMRLTAVSTGAGAKAAAARPAGRQTRWAGT
jgi:hypothetical protein